MNKYISWVLGVVLLIGVMAPISNALAMTVSPAKMELSTDPGQTITGEFIVINDEAASKTFYTSVENFEAQGETGTPNFTSNKEGLASWISIKSEITLDKNEQKTIPFTVTIPQGAEAGGYFSAIFLSATPPVSAEKAGEVSVGAKIGVLVLLTVSGPVKEGGGITEFATKGNQKVFTSVPVPFFYRFNNDGSDRVHPEGDVSIKNTFGLTTATFKANQGEGNILPKSTRRFEVLWGTKETPDQRSFFDAVGYELTHFAFGMYTAQLDLAYGSTKTATSSFTFFVFPWHLILVIVIILAILILVLPRLLKRYNRSIVERALRGK